MLSSKTLKLSLHSFSSFSLSFYVASCHLCLFLLIKYALHIHKIPAQNLGGESDDTGTVS